MPKGISVVRAIFRREFPLLRKRVSWQARVHMRFSARN